MDTLDANNNFPEPSEISPRPTGVRYGVILGLAAIILGGLTYVMGGGDPNSSVGGMLGCLSGIISIAIMVHGIKSHRDNELGGFMTLGRGMSVSLWMGLVYGVIYSVWNYVLTKFIAPDIMDAALDQIREQVDDGDTPAEGLEWTETIMNIGTNPIFTFVTALLMILILGFIISLILKKDRQF